VVPSISFFSLLSSLFSLLDQPLVHQLQLWISDLEKLSLWILRYSRHSESACGATLADTQETIIAIPPRVTRTTRRCSAFLFIDCLFYLVALKIVCSIYWHSKLTLLSRTD
jgi:hypothetical protein